LNPIDIVTEYGSDALRMGLLVSRSAGISQAFSLSKVIAGRNFANKLWNIARFIEDRVGEESPSRDPIAFTDADHWLLRQLNEASSKIGSLIANYRFAEAYELMYHTVWDDLADWYVEGSKATQNTSVLTYALETILKISHPFAPFVTETIWQTLQWEEGLLTVSAWPTARDVDLDAAKRFEELQEVVTEARTVATDLCQGKQTLLYRQDGLIDSNKEILAHVARLKDVQQVSEARGLRLAIAHHEVWLDVDEQTLAGHKEKLEARLTETKSHIEKLEARLNNKSYVDNAPEAVVQQTRDQLENSRALVDRLQRELTVI
jgi:valyl-tRNA synthetase